MKRLLMDNAIASWVMAIKYCDEIMVGKATLVNKKLFVSLLQNSVELFLKQYMLNTCDYRVATVRNGSSDGQPMRDYLCSRDLNSFFHNLEATDFKKYELFKSIGFSKLKNYHKSLFFEYYNKNKEAESVIDDGLNTLAKLRNELTHFYINEIDFLSDSEFQGIYNFMVEFYRLIVFYNIINVWDEMDNNRLAFLREKLENFSYKQQLTESLFIKKLKKKLEGVVFPSGIGEDSFSIAEEIQQRCNGYSVSDIDEISAYIQQLLKYGLLNIKTFIEEDYVEMEIKIQ